LKECSGQVISVQEEEMELRDCKVRERSEKGKVLSSPTVKERKTNRIILLGYREKEE